MDSKRLIQFADACLEEAKLQAEYHGRLANNYRCIAVKTKMLKDSVQALDETIRRFEIEKAVSEQMNARTAKKATVPTGPAVWEDVYRGNDFAEFDT